MSTIEQKKGEMEK